MKSYNKSCRASPRGQKMNDMIREWCRRNMYKEACIGCQHFPVNGPEQSIYQIEKQGREKNDV